MTYTIECTDTQLRAINTALEEFFRLRLGQFTDLSDDLAMLNYQNLTQQELHEHFNEYIERRNNTKIILEAAYRLATQDRAAYGLPLICKNNTSQICQDIWQVFRHQLWLDADGPNKMPWSVDGNKPMPESGLPLVKIRKEKN